MSARILLVDDEPEIVLMIKDALLKEGYLIDTAGTGAEAVKKAQSLPDLILLDVSMPGQNGYEVCQAIRSKVACPIIFLSARDRESDRVQGLAVGGDDYLVKPFSLKELRARIHAHLRREQRHHDPSKQQVLIYGDLVIDIKAHAVLFRQEQIPFTHREFDMLVLLALHPGQVFAKEQIYDRVWGLDAVGGSATVTEHIKKIRNKLLILDPMHSYIATIWGVGYKWESVH